jgi:hypothetical protein
VPWRPAFTATANVPRVLAEWEAGATIVLQALHLNWRPLAVFCRALDGELGHPVQANAYYTPRGSQGFAVHHDTHDVLVLQVAGEKRWFLYEPVLELPLKRQRYTKELGATGERTHDLVLRAGDTLYLPRGWLHEALTSDTDSLHLTIGINVVTWMDALKDALEDCAAELDFRRSVSPDGAGGQALLEELRAQLKPERVARRLRRRLVSGRRPLVEDGLSQLRALAGLDTETAVERRATVLAELEEDGEGVVLAFEGKELRFPPQAVAEVRRCAEAEGPFCPADLPGDLDDEGRLVLVRRLVREGFLRLTAAEGPGVRSPRSDGRAGG